MDKVVRDSAFDVRPGHGQFAQLGSTKQMPDIRPITHPYIVAEDELRVRPGQVLRLTLLMHPSSRVHLTSGTLPRKNLQLARDWIHPGLSVMAPSLRVGPVLIDSDKVRLPKVSSFPKDQIWTRRSNPSTWKDDPILAATQTALLPELPSEIQEGYIRISPNPGVSHESVSMAQPGQRKDQPHQRLLYNVLTDGVLLAEAVTTAHEDARLPAAPDVAPIGDANLWVPIGPSTVMNGQAGSRPRVAGRVRDLRISDDGQRVYAATANGGVWYSGDGGNTWSPLGNWIPTPAAVPIDRAAQALTCGCLLVAFGAAADGSSDDVYVGTGELIPGNQALSVNKLGGVGVLHLDKPLPVALADPFGAHWKREAKNLTGAGVYRLARDPANPNTLVAATSKDCLREAAPSRRTPIGHGL